MDFSFHKIKYLIKLILFFSVVIILLLHSLTSLGSPSNMENLKFSIFQDYIETLTFLLLASVY